tara:strand:+ start:278 stop:877 length:600 start_codon:yes stop_codon:yes gene_type:complete
MFKELYQKSLKLAAHKSSKFFLALVSFAESSFFPIPPDVMIIPMVVAKKNDYIKIFLIATLFSVFGGLFGYFIGSLFTDKAIILMKFYGYEEQVLILKNQLSSKSGIFSAWLGTLFLAGFTPLPFKLFTITSGIINFNIFIFFLICLIARGLRFFIVAFLSAKFGETFSLFMEKKGAKWSSIIGIIIVIIAVIIYFFYN